MQALTKEGSKVTLEAVNADGLAAAVPTPVSWSLAGDDFTLTVAPDSMSATVVPNGPTAVGTLVVNAGNLTATADLSYTNDTPVDQPAAKLNLIFTPIGAAPAPAPAPVL